MPKKIFSALKVSTLALVLSFGLSYVYAWTAPTQNPPAGNVSAPINTSSTAQTKSGNLTVGTISATTHCIGADCRTAWPTGGGGGDNLGNHTATQGLNMNSNSITGASTVQTTGTNWGLYSPSGPIYTGSYLNVGQDLNVGQSLNLGLSFNHSYGSYFYLPGPKNPFTGQSTPGVGKVLTSDARGYATWETPAGVPAGAVMFFNLTMCPAGWTEATFMRGMFVRAIDNGAGVDPDGTRAPGSVQADMLKDHTHTYSQAGGARYGGAFAQGVWNTPVPGQTTATTITADGGVTIVGREVRPRNVALLACIKV